MVGLLDTESLLGIIASLLVILNVNTHFLKLTTQRTSDMLKLFVKYLRQDIRIRARLERKANWLMKKMGVDIEKFNIDALEDLDKDDDLQWLN